MSRYIEMDYIGRKITKLPTRYMYQRGKRNRTIIELMVSVIAVIDAIREAPSIDIVRCQDCKYWVYNFNGCSRNPCTEPWYATDFCNYGEREGE